MQPRLSFEFFPPRTRQGLDKLLRTAARLDALIGAATDFCSVTYGAGGSTRRGTFETVSALRRAGFNAAPHLSWSMDSADEVAALVESYLRLGVDRIVALRGDAPSGMGGGRSLRHAEALVRLLRERFGRRFRIEVAAYPEVHPDAASPEQDLHYLERKVGAGADGCITQYFYNADAYFHFVECCQARGMQAPIVPGIMPVDNYAALARFSAACGAELPRWIRKRLHALQDDAPALRRFGADMVAKLCAKLLEGGAPGLHFYTLNKAAPTAAVIGKLDGAAFRSQRQAGESDAAACSRLGGC